MDALALAISANRRHPRRPQPRAGRASPCVPGGLRSRGYAAMFAKAPALAGLCIGALLGAAAAAHACLLTRRPFQSYGRGLAAHPRRSGLAGRAAQRDPVRAEWPLPSRLERTCPRPIRTRLLGTRSERLDAASARARSGRHAVVRVGGRLAPAVRVQSDHALSRYVDWDRTAGRPPRGGARRVE
jgi:hypothetical protein